MMPPMINADWCANEETREVWIVTLATVTLDFGAEVTSAEETRCDA
jgi:hypothetical protein